MGAASCWNANSGDLVSIDATYDVAVRTASPQQHYLVVTDMDTAQLWTASNFKTHT